MRGALKGSQAPLGHLCVSWPGRGSSIYHVVKGGWVQRKRYWGTLGEPSAKLRQPWGGLMKIRKYGALLGSLLPFNLPPVVTFQSMGGWAVIPAQELDVGIVLFAP